MVRRAARIASVLVLPLGVAPVVVGGCYSTEIILDYPNDDAGTDADAVDQDAGTSDAADEDAGPSCAGDCVPINHPDFDLPMLFWFGPANQMAPACPARAPVQQDALHNDLLIVPESCDACSCKPSTGTCGLPETFTAHAGLCNTPAQDTSFDPPPAWNGSCTAVNPIPTQAQCPAGSGNLCVQSLTAGAMAKLDEQCEAVGSPPTSKHFQAPSWTMTGLSCQGYTDPPLAGCHDPGQICVPAADKAAGFEQCTRARGDVSCPGTSYTKKYVFYEGYSDDRACSACTCGPPMDSVCTAFVTLYKDGACTDPVLLGGQVSSAEPPCFEFTLKGQALGSKSLSNVTYHPGACLPAGGEVIGAAAPVRPITFCCLP